MTVTPSLPHRYLTIDHLRAYRVFMTNATTKANDGTTDIYEGAEVLVFTKGNRGYMARVSTVWANGDVTLLPCSYTIPSMRIKGSAMKSGTKINILGSALGKLVFSYRKAGS